MPIWNQATRDNYRVVSCSDCPNWIVDCGPGAPIKAHREARKHSRRFPGHTVVIIDMTRLDVEHRYRVEALPLYQDEPPF